jgi:hypothetical protein
VISREARSLAKLLLEIPPIGPQPAGVFYGNRLTLNGNDLNWRQHKQITDSRLSGGSY